MFFHQPAALIEGRVRLYGDHPGRHAGSYGRVRWIAAVGHGAQDDVTGVTTPTSRRFSRVFDHGISPQSCELISRATSRSDVCGVQHTGSRVISSLTVMMMASQDERHTGPAHAESHAVRPRPAARAM
jgi:hypothetical protein